MSIAIGCLFVAVFILGLCVRHLARRLEALGGAPTPDLPELVRARVRARVADLQTTPGRERLRARLEAIRAKRDAR